MIRDSSCWLSVIMTNHVNKALLHHLDSC